MLNIFLRNYRLQYFTINIFYYSTYYLLYIYYIFSFLSFFLYFSKLYIMQVVNMSKLREN